MDRPDGDKLRNGDDLKQVLSSVQIGAGKANIDKADANTLEAVTATAVAECVNERSQLADMEYVCRGDNNRKGDQAAILRYLGLKAWADIRATFHSWERHDTEQQNRLACYSGPQLKALVAGHCPAPKPGPPPVCRDH